MSSNNLTNKQCKYCGKFFRWTSSLKLHLRIHTNERPFSCSKCDKTFTQKIHLQRHSPVHRPGHIVRAYSRNYENKPDMSASAAGDDRVSPFGNSTDGAPTTTNTEDIRCQECDTTFDRWLDLLQHTSEAHPRLEDQQDVNETCEDDDNEPTAEDLDGGESRLRTTWCHICKKHLATVSSRNLHMRIHTGERPFACNVCGKSFTQNVHLRSHMSVHTGAKPYLCKICNKGFVAGRTLKIHMMSHTREQPHTCQWCSRKFLVRQHLITHIHIHHADMVRTSAQDDDDEGDEEESPPTMVATSQVSDGVVRNSSATLRLTSPKRRHLSSVASSALVRSKRKASSSLHKSRKQRAIDIRQSNVARRLQSSSRQQVFDEGEDTELADIITSMDTGDIKTEASTTAETEGQNYWENDTNAGDTMKIDACFSELFQSPKTSKPLDVIVEEKPRPTVTLKTSRRKCASTSRAVRFEQHQQQQHGNSSSNNRSFPSTSSSVREASSSRTNANNSASMSSASSASSSSFQLVNVHSNKVGPSNGHNNNVNNNNNGFVSSQNNTFHQHHHHHQQQQQQQQHLSNHSSANSSSSASNRNRHNESGGIGVVGSSMQQCPNCMLVEGELQLLKTELAMIKQFLGNKLTLMEQKIDNMTTMIRQ